jgi:hypothetical protein
LTSAADDLVVVQRHQPEAAAVLECLEHALARSVAAAVVDGSLPRAAQTAQRRRELVGERTDVVLLV